MDLFSRVVQKALTTTTAVTCREPELFTGKGAIYDVVRHLIESDRNCIMVSTKPYAFRVGMIDGFLEELEHAGIHYVIYDDIVSDPTIECIEKIREKYVEECCEAMVAIGGGSVIDASKAALARVVKPKQPISKMGGVLKVHHKLPDLYAVPTTAGTGSETTAAAVVTDTINGIHYKYSINDPCLIPRYAVLDPMMTISLSKSMTATTGMDALTHAIEAYTNLYASDKVKEMSCEAVRLIFGNLKRAYDDGTDIEAREAMQKAAYYAGIAFTNNFVGYVHAVAHAMGGLYGMPHGLANAIILPYVMEQFGPAINLQLADLARASGIASQGSRAKDAAADFIQAIRNMNESMDIPNKIEKLKREDYNEIISRAIKEANPTYPVPVIWNERDFGELLNKLIIK